MTDDERRTFFLGLGGLQRLADSSRVVAVDLLNEPVPSLILGSHILGGHLAAHGGELNLVAVVEHDQVVQPQRACHTACAL